MARSRKVSATGGGFFTVASLVSLFVGLAEFMLALRVFLRFFFTMSERSGFVHWAVATTNPLLSPFRGVFVNPTATPTRWYIDFPALFAMATLAVLAAWLVHSVGLLGNWRLNTLDAGGRR